MNISSERFMQLVQNAEDDAREYGIEAIKAEGDRRSMLLRWSDQRQADADFYRIQAGYAQAHEAKSNKEDA